MKNAQRIVSWGVRFDLNKKCDRSHGHGQCLGRETKVTQMYTDEIVGIILKTVYRRMSAQFYKKVVDGQKVCNNYQHEQTMHKRWKKKEIAVALKKLPEHHIQRLELRENVFIMQYMNSMCKIQTVQLPQPRSSCS